MSIYKIFIFFNILLILFSIGMMIHFSITRFLQNNYYEEVQGEVEKFMEVYEENKNDIYVDENLEDQQEDTKSTTSYNKDLIGVLEIPEINIKVGFYNPSSSRNSVDYGIEILEHSNFPDEKGQLYIAGHSGTGKLAYFEKLSKLAFGDTVNIYYKNKKYTYVLTYKDTQEKDGELSIHRTETYPLVLVTCTPTSKTTQDIYYFKTA